jgi:hypothetical protein
MRIRAGGDKLPAMSKHATYFCSCSDDSSAAKLAESPCTARDDVDSLLEFATSGRPLIALEGCGLLDGEADSRSSADW